MDKREQIIKEVFKKETKKTYRKQIVNIKRQISAGYIKVRKIIKWIHLHK